MPQTPKPKQLKLKLQPKAAPAVLGPGVPPSRESELEGQARTYVESLGGKLIKLTAFKGIPDRMILLPGGLIMFAEFKASGKKPRKLQWYVIKSFRDMGFNSDYYDNLARFKQAVEVVLRGFTSG